MLVNFFQRKGIRKVGYTDEEVSKMPICDLRIGDLTTLQAQSLFHTIESTGAYVLGEKEMRKLQDQGKIIDGNVLESSETIRQTPRLRG